MSEKYTSACDDSDCECRRDPSWPDNLPCYWANPANNVFDLEIRIQISTSDELRTRLKAMTEDELIEFILQNAFRNNARRVLESKLRENKKEQQQ